jgi:hypothetical protein
MRIGAALFLAIALVPGIAFPSPGGSKDAPEDAGERLPRGPYLLRQIFGDLPRSSPSIWDIVPGIRRDEVPAGADLGEEEKGPGSPLAYTRDISGRATVTFVFDERSAAARLNHITVTIVYSPGVTSKALLTHLTKIYGLADPLPAGQSEVAGSWQEGTVLLRQFPSARFFEVTLSAPRSPTPKTP